jgi:hypothetical protein
LQIPDPVQAYLDGLSLSDTGKGKVEDFLDYAIVQVDDAFRCDPDNRPWPNDPYFQRELLLLDVDVSGKKTWHKMMFVVNDAAAPYGVLVLVYVDHKQV